MKDEEIYDVIYPKYMKWVDEVSEAIDFKTYFTPQEIVNRICQLMNENFKIEKV
jgi:hypothetical protein